MSNGNLCGVCDFAILISHFLRGKKLETGNLRVRDETWGRRWGWWELAACTLLQFD